jgi:hypothetical protein
MSIAAPPAPEHDFSDEARREPAVIGHGGPPVWLRKLGRALLSTWSIIVLLYLFTPILVVVLYSFNDPAGSYNYKWDHFSLDAWSDPFRYEELQEALFYSLRIAVVVTIISTIIGTMLAMALVKYRFKAKGPLGVLLVLPLTLPEVVLGFSLLTLFVGLAWQRGFLTIVIAQVMFSISYVALTVRARIRGFEWRLEEAALRDAGAYVSQGHAAPHTAGRHRGRPTDVRALPRRLHHHVPQLRYRRDVPDRCLDQQAESGPAPDQRDLDDHPACERHLRRERRRGREPSSQEARTGVRSDGPARRRRPA